MSLDVRTVDLRALNSLTKYPSIPTYHELDPRNGGLLDRATAFPAGEVIATEKIDGTNGRIVLLPDGSYLIGSREHLLYARGDLIGDPALGIADALRPVAERLAPVAVVTVLYLEVYGGKVTAASREYTDDRRVGVRMFDAAPLPDATAMLDWPAERIAAWRDGGGQPFVGEPELAAQAERAGVELAPRLFTLDAADLPTDLEKTRALLAEHLPATRVALDRDQPGRAEGIVFRTADRSVIAKARFQDYDRTLKRHRSNRPTHST